MEEAVRVYGAIDPRINCAPPYHNPEEDLPFLSLLVRLHRRFTHRQQALLARRREILAESHAGNPPGYEEWPAEVEGDWEIELPEWCQDQRNQMTGPADDGDLVVKMLRSGAPGVMLDLEDSMLNAWSPLDRGIANIVDALHGAMHGIPDNRTVVWIRPRGLHLHQAGVIPGEVVAAPVFDLASIVHRIDPDRLRHPLAVYIPKSETAEEALWWRDLFRELAAAKGRPPDWIRCMALVESHPLAYQLDAFAFNLREHLLGLNLGRWDYMASLAHHLFEDPRWVLPDRNAIPHDIPFFQVLRGVLPDFCHRHGMLAIGGMTALFPDRADPERNARALEALESDKRNEARCRFDGAWTGHPDQNEIAVRAFPIPNQLWQTRTSADRRPDLRPAPERCATPDGTRAAVRAAIRYRYGVLCGRGASLLDGYMEDLATDRIHRLLIAQRLRHGLTTADEVRDLFDDELDRLVRGAEPLPAEFLRRARKLAEAMILRGEFDPS